MWRVIVTVVVLPALIAAQTTASPDQYLKDELPRPSYQVTTTPQGVRQGSTGEAILLLLLGDELIVSPRESSHDLVPLKIEFDSSDGIAVISLSSPPYTMMRVALQSTGEPLHASLDPPVESAAKAGSVEPDLAPLKPRSQQELARLLTENPPVAVLNPSIPFRFKVKVSKSAAIGQHQLHGRVTYQPVRAQGAFPPQQMDVVIPITVVDRKAALPKPPAGAQASVSNPHEVRDIILIILLAPLWIPLGILAALVGMDC